METMDGLLAEKLALLKDVLAETERQRDLIAGGDDEGLCASLALRQARMDAVDALDARAAGLGQGAARLQPNDGIAPILRRIVEIDNENRRKAAELAGSVADGFRGIGAMKNMRAYMPAADMQSKFVNREG